MRCCTLQMPPKQLDSCQVKSAIFGHAQDASVPSKLSPACAAYTYSVSTDGQGAPLQWHLPKNLRQPQEAYFKMHLQNQEIRYVFSQNNIEDCPYAGQATLRLPRTLHVAGAEITHLESRTPVQNTERRNRGCVHTILGWVCTAWGFPSLVHISLAMM